MCRGHTLLVILQEKEFLERLTKGKTEKNPKDKNMLQKTII